MATSIVKVYNNKYGKWEANAKVVLGWNGIASVGHSRPVYTNSQGIATIEHSSSGKAEVYVNGKLMGHMKTPGSYLVELP